MHDELHSEIETTLDATGDPVVLRVSGEVDLYSAPRFEAALEQATSSARDVEVDLARVEFMDSTGLRALLEARRRSEAAGRALSLHLDGSGPVVRLLELAGVADLFPRC